MKLVRFLLIMIVAAAVVFLGPQLTGYIRQRDAIPPGVILGGVSIGGATANEAEANVRKVFESPILVYHDDRRLVLRAEDIGFTVDAASMVAEAQRYGRGLYYVRDFLLYLADKPPLGGDVPLRFDYDRGKLGAWLQAQATAYDNDPTPAYAKLDTLQFVPGEPGRYSDLNTTAANILAAFTNAYDRQARFVFDETPPLPPDTSTLESALRQRMQQFPGIYSLYYQDLNSGQVIDVDGDTPFAGMSTVKIPILLKVYFDHDLPLDPRDQQLDQRHREIGHGQQCRRQRPALLHRRWRYRHRRPAGHRLRPSVGLAEHVHRHPLRQRSHPCPPFAPRPTPIPNTIPSPTRPCRRRPPTSARCWPTSASVRRDAATCWPPIPTISARLSARN